MYQYDCPKEGRRKDEDIGKRKRKGKKGERRDGRKGRSSSKMSDPKGLTEQLFRHSVGQERVKGGAVKDHEEQSRPVR